MSKHLQQPAALSDSNSDGGPGPWVIRGEGNANLVFAYAGKDPALVGAVLRVRKASAVVQTDALEREIWDGAFDWDLDPGVRELRYISQHLVRRLGLTHVALGVPMPVPKSLLIAAGHRLESSSTTDSTTALPPASSTPAVPAEAATLDTLATLATAAPAVAKAATLGTAATAASTAPAAADTVAAGSADTAHSTEAAGSSTITLPPPAFGLMLSDHTSLPPAALPAGFRPVGPTICVEIKPKCGFLPTADVLPVDSVKRLHTRFAMHMLLKHLKKGVIRTEYSPLDFFSGQLDRCYAALMHLLEAPSNNLRIFSDGVLVYGGRPGADSSSAAYSGDTHSLEALRSLLQSSWGMSSNVSAGQTSLPTAGSADALPYMQTPDNHVMHMVAQMLLREGILDSLLKVQRLDHDDIEVIYQLYQQLCMTPLLETLHVDVPSQPQASCSPDCTDTTMKAADREADRSSSSSGPLASNGSGRTATPKIVWTRAEAVAAVRDYLTSATAKDCGIMITLQLTRPEATGESPTDPSVTSAALPPATSQVTAAAADVVSAAGSTAGTAAPAVATTGTDILERVPDSILRPARVLLCAASGRSYAYRMVFVDLDVKGVHKIPTHYKLDRSVVEVAKANTHLLKALPVGLAA